MCKMDEEVPCLEGEIWKPVKGYEDFYFISTFGRIRCERRARKAPRGRTYTSKPRLMLFKEDKDGYYHTALRDSKGNRKHFRVHRLVAEHFVGPCPGDNHDVNHINRCRTDNTPENLEWIPHKDHNRGERSYMTKLAVKDVKFIRDSFSKGSSYRELADKFKVSRSSIEHIIAGRRWRGIGE